MRVAVCQCVGSVKLTDNLCALQARHAGEVEALQRSLEQREKTAKELHARIHQLEEAEMALSQTNASLALKVCCRAELYPLFFIFPLMRHSLMIV